MKSQKILENYGFPAGTFDFTPIGPKRDPITISMFVDAEKVGERKQKNSS